MPSQLHLEVVEGLCKDLPRLAPIKGILLGFEAEKRGRPGHICRVCQGVLKHQGKMSFLQEHDTKLCPITTQRGRVVFLANQSRGMPRCLCCNLTGRRHSSMDACRMRFEACEFCEKNGNYGNDHLGWTGLCHMKRYPQAYTREETAAVRDLLFFSVPRSGPYVPLKEEYQTFEELQKLADEEYEEECKNPSIREGFGHVFGAGFLWTPRQRAWVGPDMRPNKPIPTVRVTETSKASQTMMEIPIDRLPGTSDAQSLQDKDKEGTPQKGQGSSVRTVFCKPHMPRTTTKRSFMIVKIRDAETQTEKHEKGVSSKATQVAEAPALADFSATSASDRNVPTTTTASRKKTKNRKKHQKANRVGNEDQNGNMTIKKKDDKSPEKLNSVKRKLMDKKMIGGSQSETSESPKHRGPKVHKEARPSTSQSSTAMTSSSSLHDSLEKAKHDPTVKDSIKPFKSNEDKEDRH